jgi:hypothetical protein
MTYLAFVTSAKPSAGPAEEKRMPENTGEPREFEQADLTGARFRKVHLNDARFRMVDLSGVVMRDIDLSGAEIDGAEIDGLRINGVAVAPLIEAELARREPARALWRATEPAELRESWTAIQQSWAATYDRVATMPAGTVDISVGDEWSFAQTVRHMVFVIDAWLSEPLGNDQPFHPWGMPFSGLVEFVDRAQDIGIDVEAKPSYAEALALRADRVAKVGKLLDEATPDSLARTWTGPLWSGDEPVSVLRCLWVVLNEECEHLRFAQRDLDAIEAQRLAGSRS